LFRSCTWLAEEIVRRETILSQNEWNRITIYIYFCITQKPYLPLCTSQFLFRCYNHSRGRHQTNYPRSRTTTDWSSDANSESFCSHRQPRGAALAPQPSACVEQSSSRIDEATISSVFFSLKLSFSLSSCLLLSRIVFSSLGCHSDFPLPFTHQRRSVYSCDGTHSARWARVRELERKNWTLSIFNSIFIARQLDWLETANVFSAWIWRERNIFDPFCRIFNMLCYILLLLTHNKSILVNANNLEEIID